MHGTDIFQEGISQSRTRDEKAQGRHVEEWGLGPQGQKSQAGHCHRPVGGPPRGRQGAKEENVISIIVEDVGFEDAKERREVREEDFEQADIEEGWTLALLRGGK